MKITGFAALVAALIATTGTVSAGSFDRAFLLDTDLAPGDTVSLNPQPLPPGGASGIIVVGGKTHKGPINPLRRGSQAGIIVVGGKGDAVSLNPQPLPPKALFLFD